MTWHNFISIRTVYPNGGLSIRLRVMAAYMYIAQAHHNGAHLVFIWDVNAACPGHFLQIFEPISTVVFGTNNSRYVLDKKAKVVYENSLAVFTWTMTMNNVPKNRFGLPTWRSIEYDMYSRYVPNREVMNKVTAFVREYNICSSSAMHLRATDLSTHLARENKRLNLASYYAFVESRPADEAVFILTDNPDSQRHFLDKYGPKKIIVYSIIAAAEHQMPLRLSTTNTHREDTGESVKITDITANNTNKITEVNVTTVNTTELSGDALGEKDVRGRRRGRRSLTESHSKHLSTGGKRGKKSLGNEEEKNFNKEKNTLTEDHRFTSLEHTLVDVLIASHSQTFKPAMYSSLSDLVSMFGKIGKKDKGWCE